VTVVLSDDSAPYQEVFQVISAYLDAGGHETSQVYVDGLTAASLNEARLTVAVGVRAAESLAALPQRTPVLAVLVPRAWYLKTGRLRLTEGGRRGVSAIYIDQPFERQAQLIRLAFPDVRRVGVLLSAEQGGLVEELDEALRSQRLGLVHATLAEGERLITPLENVLSEADLLLAVPDPLVFNRNTAQSLFLTSYRYRDPVLGYSRSLTRAGALLSLHSSPAQIGRQAADWVSAALGGAQVRLPAPAHPAYFSVSINEQVARSLGFALLPEEELEKRLGGVR
jgi:putative tryptophan/tyrosine transport system substrate-binding protein